MKYRFLFLIHAYNQAISFFRYRFFCNNIGYIFLEKSTYVNILSHHIFT